MRTRILKGTGVALCLACQVLWMQAQTTAKDIVEMRTFRERLVWTGDREPTSAENQELVLRVLNHLREPEWISDLEGFLKDHPDSPWAASLHYDYASYCRRTGRTTKALEQFQSAWACTKEDSSAAGRRLSGTILGNWTDLLSSLGRLEDLKKLVAIGERWQFINPGDRDKFQGARHSYFLMQEHPEIAFRCGTFALKAVGGAIQPTNTTLESLVEVPSPTNGFSMAALLDLARRHGLNMVAVRRPAGQDLVVPSVVHWRQNHYAAILGKQDDLYLVSDPTFGRDQWLPAEVINQEASGAFLIPSGSRPNSWTELALNDAKTIRGMGLPNNIKDGKDQGCKPSCPCPPCKGMPIWWVSEPYINLWMADEPLSYNTSRGDAVTLRLSYKQRDSRVADQYVSNVGWNNSWSSYIHVLSGAPCGNTHGTCLPALSTSYVTEYLATGGEVDFNPGQSYDSQNRIQLQQVFAPNGLATGRDDGAHGLEIVNADGSLDVYGTCIAIPAVFGDFAEADCLRTRHISANGDTTFFEYAAVNLSQYVLTFVIDPDGRTNTLSYTGQNLLSTVTNAYGQSTHLLYDSQGNLTNIVDAQGLSSSITYDASNNPTALITPYGTNTFAIYQDSTVTSTNGAEGNFGGHNLVDRAVQVTDPVGANYVYLYRYDCSAFMSTNYPSANVPTNTPFGTLDDGSSGSSALTGVCYRNSFYWGPRQYPNLSTTVITNFTANDYLRGRMQHWLEDTNQLFLTDFLSVRQDASPDGSTPGLLTFFDYAGKLSGYNFCEGTSAQPSVQAWRLSNGETHYQYSLYDSFGNVTNDITTYTLPNGGVGTRTNQYLYTTNIYTYTIGSWTGSNTINSVSSSYTVPDLLTKVIGPDGNAIWAYGGFDTVTWSNVFTITGGQQNGTTLVSSRISPNFATNGLGQVATTTYTSTGTPVNFYDLNPVDSTYGTVVDSTFSGHNKVISATSVAGLTTTNTYNANGFLARTIDLQIGRTNSFGYTIDGLLGTATNELGLNLTFTWDNLLRLTSVQYPDSTYASNVFTRLDLTGRRDRLGNFSHYGYDGARHLTALTNANSAVWQFNWCGCGALNSITDPLTNTTSFGYDNQGNLTNVAFPDGSSLNYQYDLAARRMNVGNGAGWSERFGYDNQGLVTSVSNAFGRVKGISYDVRDRESSFTDNNGITVTNSFDLLNRIITRTWPDNIAEGYGYSPQGLAYYTNRDREVTQYGRDAAGRLLALTNANAEVFRTAYDPAGNVTSLVDGLSHTNSWQYNQFGWLTNKVDPLGRNASQYAYNANGWLTNRVTPEKGNTGYTYDNFGNLKSVIYPQLTISFGYDSLNRLTNMVDAVGTNTFSYTPVGQLAAETGPWPNNSVSYTYSQQLRATLTLAEPGGSWPQSYGYDSIRRMTNLISPAGAFSYVYNYQPASSLISEILLPDDAYVTNSYDSLARLTQTALNNYWGHTLDGYSYQDDPLGLRTNITRNLGLTTSTVAVGYDSINQLTSWIAKEAGGAPRLNEQLGFGYDAGHNLRSRTNGSLVQTFNADAANELTNVARIGTFTVRGATPAPATNVTVNGQLAQVYGDLTFAGTNNTLASGTNTFTIIAQNAYGIAVTNTLTANLPSSVSLAYDSNGNLTNDGSRTFGYNAENELTNITVVGRWRSDFVYDGLNRRRIARDYAWSGSAWTETNEVRYVYDGRLVIQERDTNNNVLVTYTRGLDLGGGLQTAGGTGGLLARTDGSGSVFYHADGGGNITALIDNRQNIVARYEYDPFGNTLAMGGTNANANRYRFSSKEIHPNSGLYYYGFRFYQPNVQRWLNQDPIQEGGGINLYRFVGNNPLRYSDSLGFQDTGFDPRNDGLDIDPDPMKTEAENGMKVLSPAECERLERDREMEKEFEDFQKEQAAQQKAQKDAESVKSPDSTGSEGDNAPPKTIKSPKPVSCPPIIYRGGKPSPSNLKTRPGEDGISFRNSLSNPLPKGDRAVFPPGSDYFGVDTSKLPPESVVPDDNPPGHVTVKGVSPEDLKNAVAPDTRGTFPK